MTLLLNNHMIREKTTTYDWIKLYAYFSYFAFYDYFFVSFNIENSDIPRMYDFSTLNYLLVEKDNDI